MFQGNDARFIADSLGLKVIGIDISPTAVEAAQQEPPHENVSFRVGDFFAATEEQFDLIYDYTFRYSQFFTVSSHVKPVIDFS
jgi:2-polyprenyl-3-methyl-5-hydroxy-6-metoxy-1,4-benzoquinol methylase